MNTVYETIEPFRDEIVLGIRVMFFGSLTNTKIVIYIRTVIAKMHVFISKMNL